MDVPISPLVPWHMWGTSQVQTVSTPGGGLQGGRQAIQLAKVNYARPETWTFLLTAQIEAITSTANVVLQASFNVIVGIGRDNFRTPEPTLSAGFFATPQTPFCQFVWTAIPPAVTPDNIPLNPRWATSTRHSPFSDGDGDVFGPPVYWFPAQDIQCSCILGVDSAAAAELKVRVGAYFAPRTHIRPEWYSEKYRGAEHHGT